MDDVTITQDKHVKEQDEHTDKSCTQSHVQSIIRDNASATQGFPSIAFASRLCKYTEVKLIEQKDGYVAADDIIGPLDHIHKHFIRLCRHSIRNKGAQ